MAIDVIIKKGRFAYDELNNIVKIGNGKDTFDDLEPFNYTPINDNLTSLSAKAALSAKQGNVLNVKISAISDALNLKASASDLTNAKAILQVNINNVQNNLNSEIVARTTSEGTISNRIEEVNSTLTGRIDGITSTQGTGDTDTEIIDARTIVKGNSDNNGSKTFGSLHSAINAVHDDAIAAYTTAFKAQNDITTVSLALKNDLKEIHKDILITNFDKYFTNKILNEYINIYNKEQFDKSLTLKALRTILTELEDEDYRLKADSMATMSAIRIALNTSTQNNNELFKLVEDLRTDTDISKTDITDLNNRLAQNTTQLQSDIDKDLKFINEDIKSVAQAVSTSIKELELFISKLQLDTQSTALALRSTINSANESTDKNAEQDIKINKSIEDIVNIYNHLKEIYKDLNLSAADREELGYAINKEFKDIYRELTLHTFDNYFTNNALKEQIRNYYIEQFDKEITLTTLNKIIQDLQDYNKVTNADDMATMSTIRCAILTAAQNDKELKESINSLLENMHISQDDIISIQDKLNTNSANIQTLLNNYINLTKEVNFNKNDIASDITALSNSLRIIIKDLYNYINELNVSTTESLHSLKLFIDSIKDRLSDDFISSYDKWHNLDMEFYLQLINYYINYSQNKINEFDKLIEEGISPTDYSSAQSLEIDEPRLININFTNISSMPTSKTQNTLAKMEYYDTNGTYFRKNVILNAQGSSSMGFIKKNVKFDILNSEDTDDSFDLKIGNWVAQDGFHLKAYYTDFFKGIGVVSYKIYEEILKSRGIFKDRPWKKSLLDIDNIRYASESFNGIDDIDLQFDTGALCHPDGIPCVVHLNGKFYGVFSFQLKKHRNNMHQSKSIAEHIHLDGVLNTTTIFNRENMDVAFTQFEIRNPKNLYCQDGTEYNGDAPLELIDSSSEYYNLDTDSSKVKKNKKLSAQVKGYIKNFSHYMFELNAAREEGKEKVKELFETYFDVENQIDYIIFSDVLANRDGFSKNWQWTTYDGVKWFVNAYDLDMTFGGYFQGTQIQDVLTGHINNTPTLPSYYVINYYTDELLARYKELRNQKIIDSDNIMKIFNDWVNRIGTDNYKKEYEKWSDSPCNGESIVNTNYWELQYITDENGNQVPETTLNTNKSNISAWRADTEYNNTDNSYCYYGISALMKYYIFKCKVSSCENQVPITQFKHRDNIYRVKKWIDKSIENMDRLYQYSLNDNLTTDDIIEFMNKINTELTTTALIQKNLNTQTNNNLDSIVTEINKDHLDDVLTNLSLRS